MAEIVLFHHVRGLTPGVRRLADAVRAGGHTVYTPDFFEGATFGSLDDGFAALRAKGEGALDAFADAVVAGLPYDVVYAGISLGVMPAQRLAQTRPGAGGAFLQACVPASEFGAVGPQTFPCRCTAWRATRSSGSRGTSTPPASSLPAPMTASCSSTPVTCTCSPTPHCPYDAGATAQVVERVLELLSRL